MMKRWPSLSPLAVPMPCYETQEELSLKRKAQLDGRAAAGL